MSLLSDESFHGDMSSREAEALLDSPDHDEVCSNVCCCREIQIGICVCVCMYVCVCTCVYVCVLLLDAMLTD